MKGYGREGINGKSQLPVFLFINTVMKSFKQILFEAKKQKEIDYSRLSIEEINHHHSNLTPEEKRRFSDLIDDESSIPVLRQQQQALKTIHADRKVSVLLSKENIKVNHDPTSQSAIFDLKKRELTIPSSKGKGINLALQRFDTNTQDSFRSLFNNINNQEKK